MRAALAPLIFIIHTPLQVANLALWGSLIVLFGLVKLLLPFARLQRALAILMQVFLLCFGRLILHAMS